MRQIIYGVHYAAVPPEQAFLHSANLRRILFNWTSFFPSDTPCRTNCWSFCLLRGCCTGLRSTGWNWWLSWSGRLIRQADSPNSPVHQFLIPTFRHPFRSQWKNSSTDVSRSDENAVRAFDWRTRRRIITGSVMALSGMLQVSRRARLQQGADLFRWQKVYVSAKWEGCTSNF